MDAHHYRTDLVWQGSTGLGYRSYDRAHRVRTDQAGAELLLSSDPAFRGDPSKFNPEQLLLAALSSCQLLSFLAVAARRHLDVVSYRDSAAATMPMPSAWMETVTLRPVIEVRPPAEVAAVMAMVSQAHEECFISRSVKSEVTVKAQVTVLEGSHLNRTVAPARAYGPPARRARGPR